MLRIDAINQWNVASLQPPSLKAMIPIAGDSDIYREIAYNGGIFNEGFVTFWWEHTYPLVCGFGENRDIIETLLDNPFYDPDVYGFMGSGFMAADPERVIVPLRSEMPLMHDGHIHVRGSSEGYINAASEEKKLALVSGNFIQGWMYTPEAVSDHMRFFDYYLKGVDNDLKDDPAVRMMVRTGDGDYYWQYEHEWPISRTEYTKYYLDATPSSWAGDGFRDDFMILSSSSPSTENAATYSAEVNLETDPCWAHGVSFVTEPLAEDVLIAGYIKLVLWVSSTAHDMDIFASVRVMDENDQEVAYTTAPEGPPYYPVGLGWLKVSRRELDPVRSTEYRPYHTHLESHYAPLTSNDELVEVVVEIWPTTALVRAGHRIRLDVQPYDGCDHGDTHAYDESYHVGVENTIYTGPNHISYLQLPVIPAED